MEAHAGQPVRKIPRRFQGRLNTVRAGVIAVVIVLVATFLAFTKELPWQQPFELKAVFQSAANIRLDSPVRIAGVEVGEVTKVEHLEDSDLAVVTMEIDESGLPIHEDATLKIRPRLFLEGNFFVDMTAGTPDAATVEDGDMIPVTQTAWPVQLDQLLTSLQADSRKDLQDLLAGLGGGLTYQPTQIDDRGQDPDVKRQSAAGTLNDSLAHAGPAFKYGSQVNNAFLGTQPKDLRKLIAGLQKTFAALGRNEEQLKNFFTNFNRTMEALAAEQSNLGRSVRLLGPTLEKADVYFANFAAALPPTEAFVHAFIPAVRETPATIDASGPFLTQFTALVARSELGGLLEDLRPMTASFAKVVAESIGFNRETGRTARCFNEVILPSGDVVLDDGASTTGVPTFKEFWYSVVGLAGESQNFDGNGQYTRVQTGGGANAVKSGRLSGRPPLDNQLFGNSIVTPQGTRPTHPDKKPPYKPAVACHRNKRPDLNGPAADAGPPDALVGRP